MKKIIAILLVPLAFSFGFGKKKQAKKNKTKPVEVPVIETVAPVVRVVPKYLECLKTGYPNLNFDASFDEAADDWILTFDSYGKHYKFYYCDGKILPQEEIAAKEMYKALYYSYTKEIRDPKTFSQEEIESLRDMGTVSNRRKAAGTPMFLYEAIYDCTNRATLESHLTEATFLGRRTTVHKRIAEPLKRVEKRILDAAETDSTLKSFLGTIKSNAGYNWRLIDGTNRKSFHSLGIAIDVLPRRITGEIFWSWARDKNPEGWMLTPVSRRWVPHEKFIRAFEEEGFVWGGKWAVWDNMHFEYHPELLEFNRD